MHVLTDVTQVPDATYEAKLIVRNDKYDLAILKARSMATNAYIRVFEAPDPDARCFEQPVRVIGYPDLGGA